MKTIHINVANKKAIFSRRDGELVCGNSDYQIKFTFDSEWADYTQKTARFVWNGKHKDVSFTGDTCAVPKVTDTELLSVGVYVSDLSTTTSAKIPCVRSILCGTSVESKSENDAPPIQEKTITVTENGSHEVLPDSGYVLSKATVNVNVEVNADPVLQEKTVTENGTVTPDSGYDGLSKVTVSVPMTIPDGYIQPRGTIEVNKNGTHDVTEYESVYVDVPETIPEGYVKPYGHKEITLMGSYDVTNYQTAAVEEPNLIDENIKKGVTILGVVGTYEGESGGEVAGYTLSGTWDHTNGAWDSTIRQDINGTVTGSNEFINGTYSFTAIECNTDGEPGIYFYNGSDMVASTLAHSVYGATIDFGETEQEVTEEFYNWFTSAFAKQEDSGEDKTYTIHSGIYQINSVFDDNNEYIIYGWKNQAIEGKINGFNSYTDFYFTAMRAEQYGLWFYDYQGNYGDINPSNESYSGTITLTEPQTVSSGFYTWWNNHISL